MKLSLAIVLLLGGFLLVAVKEVTCGQGPSTTAGPPGGQCDNKKWELDENGTCYDFYPKNHKHCPPIRLPNCDRIDDLESRLRDLERRVDDLEDPCIPLPCANGGICTGDMYATPPFTCTCPPGFLPPLCNIIDPCLPDPCQNDGNCTVNLAAHPPTAACSCLPGLNPPFCTGGPCESTPCQNGGTCSLRQNDPSQFKCHCAPGFTGTVCENPVPVPVR